MAFYKRLQFVPFFQVCVTLVQEVAAYGYSDDSQSKNRPGDEGRIG